MRVIQWSPRGQVRTNGWNEMDREFDRLMGWAFGGTDSTAAAVESMAPPMDFVEEKDHYQVTVDLPGLSKDDLEVTIHDGLLTIRGERKSENEEKREGRVVRHERFSGVIERSLRLPKKVDAGQVSATFRNGVLELNIPFVPEVQPVRLQLKD